MVRHLTWELRYRVTLTLRMREHLTIKLLETVSNVRVEIMSDNNGFQGPESDSQSSTH